MCVPAANKRFWNFNPFKVILPSGSWRIKKSPFFEMWNSSVNSEEKGGLKIGRSLKIDRSGQIQTFLRHKRLEKGPPDIASLYHFINSSNLKIMHIFGNFSLQKVTNMKHKRGTFSRKYGSRIISFQKIWVFFDAFQAKLAYYVEY